VIPDACRQLLEAFECVLGRRHYFSSQISKVIFDSMRGRETPPAAGEDEEKPSARERETIQLRAHGHGNKEVADKLGVSVKTVETHRAAIMLKPDLHSIGQLVRYAIRNHIITA
jgi:DNA-binding NarL/FixJ family response regulator